MEGKDDILVKVACMLKMVNKPWESFLCRDAQKEKIELFRKHERTGRPMGENPFHGVDGHFLLSHFEEVYLNLFGNCK